MALSVKELNMEQGMPTVDEARLAVAELPLRVL